MIKTEIMAACVAAIEAEYGAPDGEDENIVRVVAPIIAAAALERASAKMDGITALGTIPRERAKDEILSVVGEFR